ncbi:MAG: hypothetical protein ACPIOQ_22265 [Promethearchaeia archaeon]
MQRSENRRLARQTATALSLLASKAASSCSTSDGNGLEMARQTATALSLASKAASSCSM